MTAKELVCVCNLCSSVGFQVKLSFLTQYGQLVIVIVIKIMCLLTLSRHLRMIN